MKWMLTLIGMAIALLTLAQDRSSADEAFSAKEWKAAANHYSKYVKKVKTDSLAWYRLGVSQMNLADYTEASTSFKRAEETNFAPNFVAYNRGKALALGGNREEALRVLKKGVDEGLAAYKALESNDTAFSSLRSMDGFQALVVKARENFFPCLKAEVRRHFDFWIGTWDVFVNDQKVGQNVISMAEGGCVLHESYTTPQGYSGQSMNYYDTQDEKWHQIWVDVTGGTRDYVEIDKGQNMLQFQCDYLLPNGKLSYSRMTFTYEEDGSVRQFIESSSDGKEWSAGFNGIYKKQSLEE